MISLKSSRSWITSAFVLTLSALLALSPALADDDAQAAAKKEAVAATQTWLGDIDAGNYAKSWNDSAKSFQKAVTSDKWVTALNGVRTPLGKSIERKLASAAYQTVVPKPGVDMVKRDFVIAQFDSSFENMKYARETVTFEKEADGIWRAAGYYIKPR
jgi:hypothetical protein